MKLKYRIEIYMEESETSQFEKLHNKSENLYFWRLASIDDDSNVSNWCTSTAGYGKTYQDAFDQAMSFYLKYKKENY